MKMEASILAIIGLLATTIAAADRSSALNISEILPPGYDRLKPPKVNGKPIDVRIGVSVLNVRTIDEGKQHFDMDIFMHQEWHDHRLDGTILRYTNESKIIFDNEWRHRLWTPDTYFKNSLDGKLDSIIRPYMYMTLDKDGRLFLAARVSLKLSCQMDLSRYPHDVQECEIQIMSLQHTNQSVTLSWKFFSVTKNLTLSQFEIINPHKSEGYRTYDIGTFECLYGSLSFRRRLGYFIINKYIPSILIVCMSFVTFWIPAEAYPARVTLSVTSLLTIVTQQYQSSTPSVSYVVALNVWMLACIGFVFFGLIEYAVVVTLLERIKSLKAKSVPSLVCSSTPHSPNPNNGHLKEISGAGGSQSYDVVYNRSHSLHDRMDKMLAKPRIIDKVSRILFPGAFLLHVSIYILLYGLS